jgi:hypothetical protein
VTSARGPEASPAWVPLRCPQRHLMPFIDRGFGYCCNLPQQNLRVYTSLAVLALNLLPVRRRAIQLLDITRRPPARQAQLVQDGRSLTYPAGPESRPRAWNRHPEITYGAILKTVRRTITTSQLSRELTSSAGSRSEDGFPGCLQSGLRLCTAERRGACDHRGRSTLRAGEKRRGRLVESKEEGIRRG